MKNYLCRPRREDKKTKILVLALAVLAFILFFLSIRFPVIKALLQLFSAVLLLIVVQLTTRFLLTDYRYELEDGCLLLSSRQGRREKNLGGIPITAETKLFEQAAWKANRSNYKIAATFSYCQNLTPPNPVYLLSPEERGFVLLTFEPDETLLRLLEEEIKSQQGVSDETNN